MSDMQRIRELMQVAGDHPNAARRMSAFRQAEAIARKACENPYQASASHPPSDCDFLQPLLAPDHFLVVPDIDAVDPATTSTGFKLEFKGFGDGCWIIGWRGVAMDLTVGAMAADALQQATMKVAVSYNGQENIVTDGDAPNFASFATLFPIGVQWCPIMRRVRATDSLIFEFQNIQPADGHALLPEVTLAVRDMKYPGT